MITIAETRGSKHWLQHAVRNKSPELDLPILHALGMRNEELVWKSPLEENAYRESRDTSALRLLNIDLSAQALATFWPRRGPVWDGLATTRGGDAILVEA